MAFNTSSGFSTLDGTCDISGTTVSNYNSTSNGAGTVTSLPAIPGYTLHFRVTFTGDTRQYVIKANASGSNYGGEVSDGHKRQDETWAATATAEPAAAAKGN